jgi:hypothetical protein
MMPMGKRAANRLQKSDTCNRSPAACYLVLVSRERKAFKSARNIPFTEKKTLRTPINLSISVNKYFISLSRLLLIPRGKKKKEKEIKNRQKKFDQTISSFLKPLVNIRFSF